MRNKSWTPIFEVKRNFLYRYKSFERIQFPLRPSAAKTVHKSQGDTLNEVVVSLNSRCKAKIPHIHYVALSRVTSLNGLHIKDLNKDKIAISDSVILEIERLRTEALMKLCYTPLYIVGDNFWKFVFHNTRSLHAHIQNVKADPNITNADVIGIAETKLCSTDSNAEYNIPGYTLLVRNDQRWDKTGRPPHGLAMYVRSDIVVEETLRLSTPLLEFVMSDVMSFKGHFQIVYVYAAPKCKLEDLKSMLVDQLLPDLKIRQTNVLIMGDFNFDLKGKNNRFLEFMENTFSSKQIVSEVTTKYQSLLDLAFLKVNPEANVRTDVLESYWSDHKIVYVAVELP